MPTFHVKRRDAEAAVSYSGFIADERCRQAAIVAAENVPGVKRVHDELCSYHPRKKTLVAAISFPTVDDESLRAFN